MAGGNREIKPVSFSLNDEHERALFEYAVDPARGKFGPYVKRLIERDRDGWVRSVSVSPVIIAVESDEDDGEAVQTNATSQCSPLYYPATTICLLEFLRKDTTIAPAMKSVQHTGSFC